MRIVSSNTPTLIRSDDGFTFEPSDRELSLWLGLLRQVPEIRTDLVAEVAERIGAHELATPAAIREAAAALYNSPDG